MKLITALTSQRLKAIVVAVALLLAGAIGGGAISTTITAAAAANDLKRLVLDDSKARLMVLMR